MDATGHENRRARRRDGNDFLEASTFLKTYRKRTHFTLELNKTELVHHLRLIGTSCRTLQDKVKRAFSNQLKIDMMLDCNR